MGWSDCAAWSLAAWGALKVADRRFSDLLLDDFTCGPKVPKEVGGVHDPRYMTLGVPRRAGAVFQLLGRVLQEPEQHGLVAAPARARLIFSDNPLIIA